MQVEHHLFCVYVKDKTVKVFVRLYKRAKKIVDIKILIMLIVLLFFYYLA